MSCTRMETRLLGYIDGRLKEKEQREMEKHLAACPACTVRVNEFRSVNSLLDELPQIEPSAAFDVRVRARIAAEPVKQPWWSWLGTSPSHPSGWWGRQPVAKMGAAPRAWTEC